MSGPVRMPESKRTVSLPAACASRTLGEAMTSASASSEAMAPSTCLPPWFETTMPSTQSMAISASWTVKEIEIRRKAE